MNEADDVFMKKDELMSHLDQGSKVFRNPHIKAAFEAIDRKDFIPEEYKPEAYEDYPVPLTQGQTISQPTTVAFMLELLNVEKGNTVLDIGSGSGWTTALLGHMVGKEGKVIGVEVLPELVEMGQKNIKKYPDLPLEIFPADSQPGYHTYAPYERILSGAAFPEGSTVPHELMFQLIVGGIMVVPIGETIVKFEKISDDDYYETVYPGFKFVPYVG